jgi:hypothetical protein
MFYSAGTVKIPQGTGPGTRLFQFIPREFTDTPTQGYIMVNLTDTYYGYELDVTEYLVFGNNEDGEKLEPWGKASGNVVRPKGTETIYINVTKRLEHETALMYEFHPICRTYLTSGNVTHSVIDTMKRVCGSPLLPGCQYCEYDKFCTPRTLACRSGDGSSASIQSAGFMIAISCFCALCAGFLAYGTIMYFMKRRKQSHEQAYVAV